MINLIPKEHYKKFILAGRASFDANCSITGNTIHFFVRRRKSSKYSVWIKINKEWIEIASYFSKTGILLVYTDEKQYRNALVAVFAFEHSPDWLTITHCNKCPKCGRSVKHSIFGFGKECWNKTSEQLKWRYK